MKLTINELRSVLRHLNDGNKNQKVFGIGNHKTGTTTLNYIMHGLGFNCAPQANLERDCTLETIKGNYKPLTKYIHHFDFFLFLFSPPLRLLLSALLSFDFDDDDTFFSVEEPPRGILCNNNNSAA